VPDATLVAVKKLIYIFSGCGQHLFASLDSIHIICFICYFMYLIAEERA